MNRVTCRGALYCALLSFALLLHGHNKVRGHTREYASVSIFGLKLEIFLQPAQKPFLQIALMVAFSNAMSLTRINHKLDGDTMLI